MLSNLQMASNTSHTVSATFTFKDHESKQKFIDFCNGDNGLNVARGWEGCESIECYEKQDNPNAVIIWQKWASKENHESYVKFRHDDGSFDFLGELIAAPPDIASLNPVVFETDKDQVEAVIRDTCNKDHNVGMKHMHDDCVFVRPTGNPLNKDGWNNMMNNKDVVVESNDLVTINKVKIVGDMAFVCYTTHGKFSYKGTKNDDIAVISSVLQRVDGKWMVVHGQRSTGRKPSDEAPNFA